MNETRLRVPPSDRSKPPVPEAQNQALQRRQALDEQQRAYQGACPGPHLFRRRPPA